MDDGVVVRCISTIHICSLPVARARARACVRACVRSCPRSNGKSDPNISPPPPRRSGTGRCVPLPRCMRAAVRGAAAGARVLTAGEGGGGRARARARDMRAAVGAAARALPPRREWTLAPQ
eukprot:scaffold1803_cov320-Prasinococcus_capsulatus_cf.AAC.2